MCSNSRVTATESTYTLEFPYRRSVGPVVGAFLTALKEQRIVGVRTPAGRVICPPLEYDPDTGDALDEIVDVGGAGVVLESTWVAHPRPKHPLQQPFAFALMQLDGASTAILHVVAADSPDQVAEGVRVRARWRPERTGHITDIECFEPEAS